MKATLVSLCQTDAAREAGRHALTPELLAATGARYSRNNEGVESIVARIDPSRLDASVDSIFRMIDYGHQSIADMVPVAIFMDGISMWLAYYVWSLASVAGGQESSTRYIRISPDLLLSAETLGIPEDLRAQWRTDMERCFAYYARLEKAWSVLSEADPQVMRIPSTLLSDTSEKAAKQIARMRRNYAFDRARYMLPAAVSTNVMLVMSARAWASLCCRLCSESLPEANALGEALRAELQLGAPRMLRHSGASEDMRAGLADAFAARVAFARQGLPDALAATAMGPAEATAHLEAYAPAGVSGGDMAADLRHHSNRYAWQGASVQRTAVRFSWDAVTFAELRDLNRHRTGAKFSTLVPRGFYAAEDQLPPRGTEAADALRDAVAEAAYCGRALSRQAHRLLADGNPTYVYWMLLGTQLDFEHATTADKFIYEAELRTGTGSHYRYAQHLHDALALWYAKFPETRGSILEGTAEPE